MNIQNIQMYFTRATLKRIRYPAILSTVALIIIVVFVMVVRSLTAQLDSALAVEATEPTLSFSMANYTIVARKLNIIPEATTTPAAMTSSSTTTDATTASTTTLPSATTTKKKR
jgi:hypothetical protein